MFVKVTHFGSPRRTRQAFTLIELMVVIAIIGVLASIVLVALASTQGRIRIDRTKETIAKLNSLVMAKWESYRTRRIPAPPVTAFASTANSTQELALARLDYMRELMRMEMPDRFADILDGPALPDPATIQKTTYTTWKQIYTDTVAPAPSLMSRPAVSYAYLTFCKNRGLNVSSLADIRDPDPSNASDTHLKFQSNQNAECLFMLVTMGLEGATSRELFSEDEIGDTDGDGFPEFIDGWGHPIKFLRWAPGFVPANGASTAFQSTETDASGNLRDPDPFDPLKLDIRDASNHRTTPTPTGYAHYALYPLIYSAGADGGYGIEDGIIVTASVAAAPTQYRYSQTDPPNDPYIRYSFASGATLLGTPIRKVLGQTQVMDYSKPDRPLKFVNEDYSALPGDEQFGDAFDNLHNQMEPLPR